MPHGRKRHLESLMRKGLKFSPIVGVFGHRQVGKSTLAGELTKNYVTLDLLDSVSLAQANPSGFLGAHLESRALPLAIDECQMAPPLFPALKEWVRLHPAPGQFLLTGSVRFSSRKAIRESLTGRMIAWELLPMDWSEMHGTELPDTIFRQLRARQDALPLQSHPAFSEKTYRTALTHGGLPGVFSVRDASIRAQRFETQLNTIIERDLRLLVETSLGFRTLRELIVALARQAGGPLELSELQRSTKISLPTLRRLIPALEALFLIRLLPSEGDYSKPVLFFEDLGEQRYLRGKSIEDTEKDTLLPFLYHHLRVQFHYRPERQGEILIYRDRKSLVPALVFRCEPGVLGVFPALDRSRVPDQLLGAQRFRQRYPGSKVWIVTPEDQDRVLAPGIRWVGLGRVLGG
jgi:predicted AAA+ superfamily ATPase